VEPALEANFPLTVQITAAMQLYLDGISDLIDDTKSTTQLWLIVVLILTILNCALSHRLINMRLIGGLLHELEETVSLFWTVPLDSMLSVPMIERFLQTGTIISGSEEESLLKAKFRRNSAK